MVTVCGRTKPRQWIAVATVAVLLAGLALVGPAFAGDAVAQFEFGAAEQSAEPGDTVTVDVVVRSDGGYAGEGIESYSFVVAVPPEVVEPTHVEPGPWLAQDGGSVNQTVSDAGEGAIRVRHERVGAEDGVTGAAVAATVTIDIREDAPAANATILIADPAAHLNGSDFPMRTFGDEATIVVSEGGAERRPAYEPGTVSSDGSVAVTTANDSNRTVEAGSDGGSSETNDPTPGFGIGIAVVAVLVASVLALRR